MYQDKNYKKIIQQDMILEAPKNLKIGGSGLTITLDNAANPLFTKSIQFRIIITN